MPLALVLPRGIKGSVTLVTKTSVIRLLIYKMGGGAVSVCVCFPIFLFAQNLTIRLISVML